MGHYWWRGVFFEKILLPTDFQNGWCIKNSLESFIAPILKGILSVKSLDCSNFPLQQVLGGLLNWGGGGGGGHNNNIHLCEGIMEFRDI